jgi:hypothetical protein
VTAEESIEVDAAPAEMFGLSQNYGRRLECDPFLRSASLDGARAAGVGVRAVFVVRSGWAMETEYIRFNPPRTNAVRMARETWWLWKPDE